ncbi:NUDIX domain-containing protein [Vibrio sp. WXL103]|uniref:NUDIX domain-containing protein n=1 Tax=Vibrio sp. WXL103 TaxID=3450710 RepID=UPI003EC651B5
MKEIKTLNSNVVYKNRWMTVREDQIERPSGHRGIYGIVEKPDFVVVLPFDNNYFYMVEQYRYAIGQRSLEFPQGSWETLPDVDPEKLALAELREETGLIANELVHIGYQHVAKGYSNQGYHIYVASNLKQESQMLEAEEEGLITKKIDKSRLDFLIKQGKITDATTVNSYLIAKLKGII